MIVKETKRYEYVLNPQTNQYELQTDEEIAQLAQKEDLEWWKKAFIYVVSIVVLVLILSFIFVLIANYRNPEYYAQYYMIMVIIFVLCIIVLVIVYIISKIKEKKLSK